jgi:pimeloyl-ACP methyl ester carboxylesterase
MRGNSSRVRLPDGRYLCWCTFGTHSAIPGRTVLYFHGYLSSRLEAAILHEDAEELGVRIIAFDRPGYGRSSTDSARSYSSVALDAINLLDELIPESEPIVLMGVSGTILN